MESFDLDEKFHIMLFPELGDFTHKKENSLKIMALKCQVTYSLPQFYITSCLVKNIVSFISMMVEQ